MLILDIPTTPKGDDHVRVGVIGSCRVRDLFYEAYKLNPKPPESASSPKCKNVWYRFSSFTHTPSQALQYFNFVTGSLDIPEVLQPLIFSRVITPQIRTSLETLTPELIETVDLFVAEVSTLKEFSASSFHINISYTEVNLVRLGGKPLLKWWRSLSKDDEGHDSVIQHTLDALPAKDIPDTEAMRSIIKTTKSHVLERNELKDSIINLQRGLGTPLMIVPSFNVPEEPVKQRTELIEMLYDLSSILGYHFYDPTVVVAEAGSKIALAGDGADKSHYAPGFHYTLLNSVVPFIQQAVAEYSATGTYKSVKHNIAPCTIAAGSAAA